MESCLWILAFVTPCFSEWVLLPPVFPEKDEVPVFFGNASNQEICPDLHNLTVMSYGSTFKVSNTSDWGISLEDVGELIKQHRQLPKSSEKKADFVRALGENFMGEAEKQLRSLFSPSREARTTHIHSPSMESALMTISILLFGVFLSKLILKLLMSHYNRYNGGVMTMVGGIRGPMTFAHGRRGRSIQSQLRNIQLMHLIDKYNSRFNRN